MRAIIFGAEKYSMCPLRTQEVPSDVFKAVQKLFTGKRAVEKAAAWNEQPTKLRILRGESPRSANCLLSGG